MNEKTYRFHFYQNKKIYFGISIVLLVVGILASVIIGPHLDIQFAGGSMILYSVEGGQADASGVEAAVSESTGRNCEVAISQDITTGGEQVTVSFFRQPGYDAGGAGRRYKRPAERLSGPGL